MHLNTRSIASTMGTALTLIIASAVLVLIRSSSTSVTNVSVHASVSSAGTAAEVEKLPGAVYQLGFDRSRESLWFAYMAPGIGDWLYEMKLGDQSLVKWDLPLGAGNGFVTRVEVAADGAIWVNEDYRLIRFEPSSELLTAIDFDPNVSDSDSQHQDPMLPGTWVSAMAVDGDDVLVARMNVPYLTRVSQHMAVVGTIPLPDGFDGARDLATLSDGSIAALSGWNEPPATAVLDSKGTVKSLVPISALAGDSRIVVVSDAYFITETPGVLRTVDGSSRALVANAINVSAGAASETGALTLFDANANMVYRVVDQKIVSQASIPPVEGRVRPAGGEAIDVSAGPDVKAMVIDDRGVTWMVFGRDQTLVRLDP
jgi:hypothetical protein